MIEQYVDQGLVRYVVRDYPLSIHASAPLAAAAAHCAADQGAYWEYSDRLFTTHGVEWGGVPNRDRSVMVEFAAGLGLDLAAFETCLADPAVEQRVQQEAADAESIGVNSTPNFVIGDRLVRGALPIEQFDALLQELLAQP